MTTMTPQWLDAVMMKTVAVRRVALLMIINSPITAFAPTLADVMRNREDAKSIVIAEIVETIAAIEWTAPTAAPVSAVVAAVPLRPVTLPAAAISNVASQGLSGTVSQTVNLLALRGTAPGAAEVPNESGTNTVLEEVGEWPDPILMPS